MTENQPIKLTTMTTKGGCGCKIGPTDLASVMRDLPPKETDPNVLVGLDTGDDAGVYKLNKDTAIVQTTDFFTPIVNDPYDFGQVAVANAVSDVYAMGGTPITALNIVAFPISILDKDILSEILRGAGDKKKEAGISLVGGHSIDDPEPKFGLAVTGTIHPDNVWTNTGAQPGDKLILTKPIGVGIMSSSIKNNLLNDDEIKQVTDVMTTLNKTASETLHDYHVHASTDVTGFGLLGHASEMAAGSDVGLTIDAASVPVLPRAKELAQQGSVPGGTKNNHEHLLDTVTYPDDMDEISQFILCDAVTSGGLLVSVPADEADQVMSSLKEKGVQAAQIGEVTAENNGGVTVQ